MPAIEVGEVKPQVVETELPGVHLVPVQVEMAQTPPAVEQSVRRNVHHSENKTLDLLSTMHHNYGRYDTDYS